jgi:hypothetical protein
LGTDLAFDDWRDPAARRLAHVFESHAELVTVERAVVAFAQARARAEHGLEAVAADLVALLRLAWPSAGYAWGDWVDPVGLLARALGAWAIERVAAGRILAARFHAGETVAALGSSRMVAVMPAYGVGGAIRDVTSDFAGLAALDEVGVTIGAQVFADDAAATFRSLAGAPVGS